MRYALIIALLLCIGKCYSQNLVPNYSFEEYSTCPNDWNQIFYAEPWFQPCTYMGNTTNSSNSDLLNACAGPSQNVGVPINWAGNQNARTGNGYAGIVADNDTANDGLEYIEVQLLSPLIAGKTYNIEFYVSLSDSSTRAISNMGAYFSQDSLLNNLYYHVFDYANPQIENPDSNMLSDKVKWMPVSGSFVASGGERFMTIGKFRTAANTNGQNVAGGTFPYLAAYYYIDDVSVTPDTTVGVNGIKNNYTFRLFPNPAKDKLNIDLSFSTVTKTKIVLCDLLGNSIKTLDDDVFKNKLIITDINDLSNGVYLIRIETPDKIILKKLAVIK